MLENVIGNPLETTIALSHLIFEGIHSVDINSHDSLPRVRRQPIEPHADTRVISGG